jgi:hypothetical protein
VRTNRVCVLGRSFMVDSDPAPVVATIKDTMRIYPYVAGAAGMSIAALLQGEVPLAASTPPPEVVYHEGTRAGDQHRAAHRRALLRRRQRGDPGRAGRGGRP